MKLEIDEVEAHFLGLEYSDVDVKHIFSQNCDKRRHSWKLFSVKAKGEHLVASKWR